jgi:hypothetical protein
LRVSLKGPVQAYATVLAVQAQAVEADFIVEGHEADEDRQPLAPHSITELVEAKGTIAGIQQPFSSRRGRAAEAELPYRLRVAEQLRHKGRALAGWDYERLLWDAFGSQLQTVLCLPAQQSKQVEVLVIPNLRQQVPRNLFSPGASGDLLAAMEQHLRQRCGPELDIRVRNATYLPVRVRCWVCLQDGVDGTFAQDQLQQELIAVLSPWSVEDGAEVRIGGQIYATDIVAAIEPLPYVDYVEKVTLFLLDEAGERDIKGTDFNTSSTQLKAPRADVVLIASSRHDIEFVSARASPLPVSGIGIGVMKIGLDFVIASSTNPTPYQPTKP